MSSSMVDVSIYLKGRDLDLGKVTDLLGINPTSVHVKGDKKVPSNENSARFATNIWSLSTRMDSSDVSSALLLLFSKITNLNNCLPKLVIDDAYIDVFLANTVDSEDMSNSIQFTIDAEVIRELSRYGLPIYFSACNVAK